ncbi:hypothetical protein SCLCIDRAFT_37440, partial [Scleroderma citrinum Foug A]
IFCPACPQLGINLPENWREVYARDTMARQYVVDGNFTAQHMNMKKPENDVILSNGLSYMVQDGPYQAHIVCHLMCGSWKQKSSCQNHHAINHANVKRSNLWATGVGATACTRHGCFVPHSMADFYKGEQQKNVDYSIFQALSYSSTGINKALIIYDVACQWYVKLSQRVEACPALQIPEDLEIVPAVREFHLSAHKLECFP